LRAREAGRQLTLTPRSFHEEHVGFDVLEPGAPQDGLIMETNVPGVEQRLLATAHHNAGGTKRVAGVTEFQRGRAESSASLVERGPLDVTVVFEPLDARG